MGGGGAASFRGGLGGAGTPLHQPWGGDLACLLGSAVKGSEQAGWRMRQPFMRGAPRWSSCRGG
jgi:hypothetical protein